ncbi:hypothetical protein ES705_32093 [subsurface metagenome]
MVINNRQEVEVLSLFFYPEWPLDIQLPEVIRTRSLEPLPRFLLNGFGSPRLFSSLLEGLPDGRMGENQPFPLEPLFTLHNVQAVSSS